MAEVNQADPSGTSAIQVRVALFGLLLSIMLGSIIPLFGVLIVVSVFAAYTNGNFDNEENAGKQS